MEKLFQEYQKNNLHNQQLNRLCVKAEYSIQESLASGSVMESPEQFYKTFTQKYAELSDDAYKELKRLHETYPIKVHSTSFQEGRGQNDKLKIVITELISTLAFRQDEKVLELLEKMGYPKTFTMLFVDLQRIIERVRTLSGELDVETEEEIFIFLNSCGIVRFQVMNKIEPLNGRIIPNYNGSKKEVGVIKAELDRRVRKRKKGAVLDLDPDSEEYELERALNLETGLGDAQTLQKILGKTNKKDADGNHNFNVTPLAKSIYELCRRANPKSTKGDIYVALYSLFEVLYPAKGMKVEADPNSPKHSISDDRHISIRSYKIAEVANIIGN